MLPGGSWYSVSTVERDHDRLCSVPLKNLDRQPRPGSPYRGQGGKHQKWKTRKHYHQQNQNRLELALALKNSTVKILPISPLAYIQFPEFIKKYLSFVPFKFDIPPLLDTMTDCCTGVDL